MTVEQVTAFISSVGFPIAAYAVLCVYIYLKDKMHQEEMTSIKASLDNNTKVLTELITLLKGANNI